MNIGILALQGDYEAHRHVLGQCAQAEARLVVSEVREAPDLAAIDGLIIPGGESTTMSRLCDRYDLWEPLRDKLAAGMGALGTCAGLILLASDIAGATRNFQQRTLGALDIDVARNAYGTQIDSFEATVQLEAGFGPALGEAPPRGVFIRAPRISRLGDVEVVARYNGDPVAVRQGKVFGATFHPEIAGEAWLHLLWLQAIRSAP